MRAGRKVRRQVWGQREAAGAAHSLCLSEDGELFAWGLNVGGALGHGGPPMSVERAPRRVLAFEGEDGESGAPLRFCFVAAGAEHSLAVGASDGARGHLFTWGRGDHGRLGHGALDEPTCRRPTRFLRRRSRQR